MKRLLLFCLAVVACCSLAQAQLSGADYMNGYRALYLSDASPDNADADGVTLPIQSNADNLWTLVETQPGSNIYTGSTVGWRNWYIYTKLVEDDSFVPGQNCVGLATEKTFSKDDNHMVKLSLTEGVESHPLAFNWSMGMGSARLLVDLNKMEIYVEPYSSIFLQFKGHEQELSYTNFENVTPVARFIDENMHCSFTEGQEFRFALTLIPSSTLFDPEQIGSFIGPSEDKTVQLSDNGIAYVVDKYRLPASPGWYKITQSGNYNLIHRADYDSEEEMVTLLTKFTEIGSVKELYISTISSDDLTDPDNVFNYQTYQVPSAENQDGWRQKLLPVEGQPGVFAGEVNMAFKEDWRTLGAVCFDTFRTPENAEYIALATYPTSLQKPTFCEQYYVGNPFQGNESRRISVYFPGITGNLITRLIVDLNKGTVEAEVEPEYYDADVELKPSDVLYLVGQPSGWNVKNVPQEWQLGKNEDGVYVRTFYIPENQFMFRFYTSLGDWNVNSLGIQELDEPVQFDFFDSQSYESACCWGKGSWEVPYWNGGYVTIQVDLQNMRVKFTQTDGIPAGEPEPGDESDLVDTYNNVTLTGDFGSFELSNSNSHYIYSGLMEIPAGVHTFGITADDIHIGAWKDGRIVDLDPDAEIYQRFFLDNENLWSTSEGWEGGMVEVKVNLLNHNIYFNILQPDYITEFPETLEIVGQFTNNWMPTEPWSLQTLGDGVYEGTFALAAGCGEFKFRKLGDWDVNLGCLYPSLNTFFTTDSPHTLQATSGGNNFKLSDNFMGGDVKFRVNLNDMTVTASTDALTGLSMPSAKLSSIRAERGQIIMSGMAGERVRVYDISGRLVLDVTPSTDWASYPVAAGFYVADGRKLLVR